MIGIIELEKLEQRFKTELKYLCSMLCSVRKYTVGKIYIHLLFTNMRYLSLVVNFAADGILYGLV